MPRDITLRDRVLKALRSGPMTAKQIADKIGTKHITVQSMMTDLRDDLLVHTISTGKPYIYALGAGSGGWTAAAHDDPREMMPPRRKAPDVRPFRDPMQEFMFGPAGQGEHRGAR